MKIGIIGPSKVVNKLKISKVARIIADSKNEVVLTADIGSSSEFFAEEYLKNKGKKIYSVLPLDDKEFGYDWVNVDLGEKINCGTWRNMPEKLNEETDILVCIGYGAGVLAEIAYSKWFKPKKIYIIDEIESEKLPAKINKELNISYVSMSELEKILK